MAESEARELDFNPAWLIGQVPFVSFFCENDALYSMRFLTFGGGEAYGYKLDDFVDNKHYFAASTTHPDDQDIVDKHAEQAVAGGSPVISRYRLVQADGEPVPVLLVSRAVYNPAGEIIGLAGIVVDLRNMPALQGPRGLLSSLRKPKAPRQPVEASTPDAAWVAAQLPVNTCYIENDTFHTARAIYGSPEEFSGYTAAQFVDARVYKAASAVHPSDVEVADQYLEQATSAEGKVVCARIRLINSDGEPFPILLFLRSTKAPGTDRLGVVVGVLDVSHAPALHGRFGVL